MDLFEQIDQRLEPLATAFSRHKTFQTFVLVFYGILLRTRYDGITACIEFLGLTERFYHQALHLFRSKAWSAHGLMAAWHEQIKQHPARITLNGRPVYVGDGIKVGKEGRRMPGVKRLKQESESNSKPTWIRGHYFGAIGMLLARGKEIFHVPIYCQLQDGLKGTGKKNDGESLVDKMGSLTSSFLHGTSAYLVLDAFYASKKLITDLLANHVDLITRVKISTVAYRPLPPPPKKRGPGRPRKWGEKVYLRELFAQTDRFTTQVMCLYDRVRPVSWRIIDLYWHSSDRPVRFVLAKMMDTGKLVVFLSTDLSLSGPQIIQAYSWRFKIESSFRMLIHLLGGFSYHFWSKSMTRAERWTGDMQLGEMDTSLRDRLLEKVEAFERYVAICCLAQGILQVLSLEQSPTIWERFPGWFRFRPTGRLASEQVVRMTLQAQAPAVLSGSSPSLLLWKFREAKRAKILLARPPAARCA